ncbi:hypothetical protein ABZS71_13060 [Streptomyces sp. NPDC005393]
MTRDDVETALAGSTGLRREAGSGAEGGVVLDDKALTSSDSEY